MRVREKAVVLGAITWILLAAVGMYLIVTKAGSHESHTAATTNAASSATSSQASPAATQAPSCPEEVPMGVRIAPIKDLSGINMDRIRWPDNRNPLAVLNFDLEAHETGQKRDEALHDSDETFASFVFTNNGSYCVTRFEWAVDLQTDTGRSWRETGETSTARPMHGEMPYNVPLRNNNEPRTRMNVFGGRVTRAWGFPIPQDRQRGENP
jgi:hypothetical protein